MTDDTARLAAPCPHDKGFRDRIEPATVEVAQCVACGKDVEFDFSTVAAGVTPPPSPEPMLAPPPGAAQMAEWVATWRASIGHGYTCDLCPWGRDKVRTVDEYAQHLRREHCSPDLVAAARAVVLEWGEWEVQHSTRAYVGAEIERLRAAIEEADR